MAEHGNKKRTTDITVTVEEVNRVLEVGRLLLSVLTPEELEQLIRAMKGEEAHTLLIGNTGES